jgi:hypothetical protein
MPKYISCRVIKIKTGQDASNLTKHGNRMKGFDGKSKIDRSRTELNEHHTYCNDSMQWIRQDSCPNYHKLLNERCKDQGAKRPKNGVFGTEMLMTASPEVFHDTDGNICDKKAAQWAEDCRAVAQEQYGGMIVASRLDMDETTPHISFFILPTYEKTYGGEKRKSKRERKPKTAVSHNSVFGGRDQYSKLQDWLAEGLQAKGWNVNRGIPVEITRAANMRPDGQAYHKMMEMQRVYRKKLDDMNTREKLIVNFIGRFLKSTHQYLPKKATNTLTEFLLKLKKGIAPLPDAEQHLLESLSRRSAPKSSDLVRDVSPEPAAPAYTPKM